MFEYSQGSGKLSHNGHVLTTAYSGHGADVNVHDAQFIPGMGPIPVGSYTIGEEFVHPHAGPICMRLTANPGTDTHGRDGFMMHGDNSLANHSASEGCIIVCRPVRIIVAEAVSVGDNQLEVTA